MNDFEFDRIVNLRENKNMKECVNCGNKADHTHHVFFGPYRKHSEKHNMKIRLCCYCHTLIHVNAELALYYKKAFQKIFEKDHSRKEFMAIFGRNYL